MARKGSTLQHQNLVKRFTMAVYEEFNDIMVLPYTVGMFRAFDNPDRIIRAGIKGVPDLIVFGKNFYVFFDAKTGKADFTKEQKAFKARMAEVSKKIIVHKLDSVHFGLEVIRGFYQD